MAQARIPVWAQWLRWMGATTCLIGLLAIDGTFTTSYGPIGPWLGAGIAVVGGAAAIIGLNVNPRV